MKTRSQSSPNPLIYAAMILVLSIAFNITSTYYYTYAYFFSLFKLIIINVIYFGFL
jgi:hypothetical protein